VIQVARAFAHNAHITKGKSMIIIGAAMNHWYHMDMNYRACINMLVFCGCIGQSGGGWSHYVGQEKLRPQTGWAPLAFALDWNRPPRQQNSTSFFYAHTDQWRYETLELDEILSPLADRSKWAGSLIDCNIRSERMGWLPSAPQLEENPLELVKQAEATGAIRLSMLLTASAVVICVCLAKIRTIHATGRVICSSGVPIFWAPAVRGMNISSSISLAHSTAYRARIWAMKAQDVPLKSSGMIKHRKESLIWWLHSTSVCQQPASIRISFCQRQAGMRRTI
jgi:hypothetical protein